MSKSQAKQKNKEDTLQDIGRRAFEVVAEMVSALDTEDDDAQDEARIAILEDALSCEVRTGWHSPGDTDAAKPEEYYLLLATGGPAVRIIGSLNTYGKPESATLQTQDWGTPWTDYGQADESVLLSYARCFYFGEG